jgi:transcription elongation GreA/GreB family factor
MSLIKEQLFTQCLAFIDDRLLTVKNTMQEIQESLLSETKSSAGDKHETGRAMLQLEREKAGNQLAEILKIKENLSKINTKNTSETIHLGSVIYTTQANYYIAISAGIVTIDDIDFYAISPVTPIAKLLLSKTVNDTITFRTTNFTITNVI